MNRDMESLTERAPSLDRDGRAAYRVVSNDWDTSTTVVRAVTEVADCDLLADDCVLYDVVDPDALNRLFAGRDSGDPGTAGRASVGRVVFELHGCRVEVRADGEHVIYEPENDRESAVSAVQSA
ncbi:HalOD1 output domain-containing protein [Halorussus lipolyticus]|uniref:HalOD1 output domain-containing protein n=1 Tax=Halorussus lipolyticus TaxID=3034024 RepID=UPI0023E7E094|nr:HalOD1 output domain-containing protein [Halorussus sp. DT80]